MRRLQPAFVAVPLDIKEELPITLLASTVSLTPGTVSSELSSDHKWLYIHALHVTDEQALIATIKSRYEAPLKEIFAWLDTALMIVSGILCVALILNLWRLLRGPDLSDRILALDTMYIKQHRP